MPGRVWKTDGFTGPAHFALDIRQNFTNFIPFHGKYLFVGKEINGNNLNYRFFITDGTMKNTVPLKDLPGIYFGTFFDYAIIDDTLYFWDGGLWKSDGTPEGTILVKRIPSDLNFRVKSFVALDHKLYFRVIDSKGDPEGFLYSARNDIDTLWVSDGTFSGTRPVAGFSTREGFSDAANGISLEMSAISGQLFFMANDGFHGNELWRLKAVPNFSFTSFPFCGTNGVFEGYYPDWQSNYIDGLYKTILNRPADKPALRHWIGLLSIGFSRERVAQAILESPEYRGIQVDSYYQRFLVRQADAQGRRAWINQLLSGVDEREVINRFLNSQEYLGRFGDNVSFLQGVYQNLFGRPASVSEVRHWDELLQSRLNRNQVIKLIIHSEEAISNEIQSLYNNFLHRDIDAQGRAMAKRVVHQKASFKEILNGIFSSPEFHQLSGQSR